MSYSWLSILSVVSLILAFICAAIILFDVVRHPQKMAVMNWVWPITGLYFGVLTLPLYFLIGKKQGSKSYWQQVLVGTTHCGAGCTLGDIVAEFSIFWIGFTIAGIAFWPEIIGDYLLAFLLGIAFQYFAIVPMKKLGVKEGIEAAVKADALSLTAFEIGLFGWMALVSFVFFHQSLHPNSAIYWFMMQVGMVIGFLTSYPMNWLLIRKGIKEAM